MLFKRIYSKEIEEMEKMDYSTVFSDRQQNELYAQEDASWWFQYRGRLLLRWAEKYFMKDKSIYDIGGGNGYTTKLLQDNGWDSILLEPSSKACKNAKERGIKKVINAGIDNTNALREITNMCCLDVLEHIEDDNCFLVKINEMLCVNGTLIITVPAFMSLWSKDDKDAGHFRRYRKSEICNKMESAGFEVIYCSYFFSFLYLAIFMARRLPGKKLQKKQKGKMDLLVIENKIVSFLLTRFLNLEYSWLNRLTCCFGSSLICIAKKKKIDIAISLVE